MENKFEVGDKVKIKGKSVGLASLEFFKGRYPDSIGYITKIYGDGNGNDTGNCLVVDYKPDTNEGNYFAPKDLELIKPNTSDSEKLATYSTSFPSPDWGTHGYVSNFFQPQKKNTMKTLTSKVIRTFSLSERELFKAGFKDENRNWTEEAWQETKEILMDEREKDLIELAKKINKEK